MIRFHNTILFHLLLTIFACSFLHTQYQYLLIVILVFKDYRIFSQLNAKEALVSTETIQESSLPVAFQEWIQEVATPTSPRQVDNIFQGQLEEDSKTEEDVKNPKFTLDPSSKVVLFTARLRQKVKEKKWFDEQVENFFQDHSIDSWNFDVFELDKYFPKNSLSAISMFLFVNKYNFLNLFNISSTLFSYVVKQVETAMRAHANPYHSHIHVADVMQTLHIFLQCFQTKQLSHLDCFAALIAALFHDYDHPGNNNLFEVNTDSERAQRFNYQSILENYHLQKSLPLLSQLLQNSNLSNEQKNYVKHTVITMILHTDISKHVVSVKNYNQTFSQQRKLDTPMLLCFLLQCADVSNSAKQSNVSLQWTERILDEFYRQGEREIELKLPISPLCDKNRPDNRRASQVGFIDYICRPLFVLLVQLDPTLQFVLETMNNNYSSVV